MSPGLKALGELPLAAWVQILAVIGVIELTVGKQDYENKVGFLPGGRAENGLRWSSLDYHIDERRISRVPKLVVSLLLVRSIFQASCRL